MSSNAGTRFFHGPRALKRAVMSSTDKGAALAASASATARTCALAPVGVLPTRDEGFDVIG